MFGLEAHYINHTSEQVKYFLDIAKERSLFVTAGSDYHGDDGIHGTPLTVGGMSYEDFKKFKKNI